MLIPVIKFKLQSTITQHDCSQILNDLYIIRGFLEANSVGSFIVKLNQQSSIMQHNSSPYGHYGSQNGNHVGQPKNTIEDAHAEEKKSLDALSRFISKFSL